jgi:hypothetical protein
MKKIICISLVFGCGKPNSVVKRESDASSVSVPDNQTNPEKQYSINEENNQQNPEAPQESESQIENSNEQSAASPSSSSSPNA